MPNVRRESLPAGFLSPPTVMNDMQRELHVFRPRGERALIWAPMNHVASLTSLDKSGVATEQLMHARELEAKVQLARAPEMFGSDLNRNASCAQYANRRGSRRNISGRLWPVSMHQVIAQAGTEDDSCARQTPIIASGWQGENTQLSQESV